MAADGQVISEYKQYEVGATVRTDMRLGYGAYIIQRKLIQNIETMRLIRLSVPSGEYEIAVY